MNFIRKTVSLILVLLLCGVPALATGTDVGPSSWAKDEIAAAIELGFVPENLLGNYQKDITRDEFAQLAVSFCAFQLGYSKPLSSFLGDYQTLYRDEYGNAVPSLTPEQFTDATEYATIASGLGIVKGKGNGIYDPNGYITRQEAATMLLRAYYTYAPANNYPIYHDANYADSAQFPVWAADSINQLHSWSVMTGNDNQFMPAAHYTREQSILTFLRLDKNALYGRAKGLARALIPFETELEETLTPKDGSSFLLHQRLDTSKATFILGTEVSATGAQTRRFWALYSGAVNIGKQDLLMFIKQDFGGTPEIINLAVDKDEKMLTFTASDKSLVHDYQLNLNETYARPKPPVEEKDLLTALPDVFNKLEIKGFDGTYIYALTPDGSTGVYDKEGHQIISSSMGTFSSVGDGIILRTTDSGLSYYSSKGTLLNQTPYVAGTHFEYGNAAVQQKVNGTIAIIDTSGQTIDTISNTYGTISDTGFDSRCVLLDSGSKHVLLNTYTKKVLDTYQDVGPFSSGMAAVKSSDGWGYVDSAFDLKVNCRFKRAGTYETGINIAVVQDSSGLYGTVDKRGRSMPIPFEYDVLSDFSDVGYALGQRTGSDSTILVSLGATAFELPKSAEPYTLFGRAVATKTPSGQWSLLNATGAQLFSDMVITGVFGSKNSEELIIKSGGTFYFYTTVAI